MARANILIKNFVLLFIGSVAGQFLFLIGMLHIARVSGPAGFGLWSYAQAWFFSSLRLGEFGLEVTGIRAIAENPGVLNERVSQVLMIRFLLAVGLFVCAVVLVGLGIVPGEAGVLVVLFCIGVFPAALTLEWLYEAVQRPFKTSLARLLRGLTFLVLVILFVQSREDIELSALLYVASLFVASVFLFFLAVREFRLRWVAVDLRKAGSLLREAWQIAAATLLSQYALFYSTILLGYTATAEELGFFSASHRVIIFLWAYGIVTSNRVLLPTLSGVAARSDQDFALFLRQATRVLLILGLPIGTIGFSLAPKIIDLLYGPGFQEAVPIFKMLLWTLVIAIARSGLEISLVAAQRQSLYLRGMLLLASLHTVLCMGGILLWGVIGMAGGMVLAEGVYALYLVRISVPTVFDGLSQTLMRVTGSSVAAALVSMAIPGPLVISLTLGLFTYALGLLLFREISSEDRALLKHLLGIRQ